MRRLLAISSLCLMFVPAALMLQPREASACSCIPAAGPVEAAQGVDLVFHAKLVSVADVPKAKGGNFDIPSKEFTFDVIRTFKGELAGQVKIVTADNSAACGRGYGKPGDEWLIYARRDDGGIVHDNLCSRSMPIDKASDDIAELEANAERLDDDPPEPEYPEDPGPAEPEPDPIPFPSDAGGNADSGDSGDAGDSADTSGEQPEPTSKPGRCTVTEDTPAGGLAGFLTLALGFIALRRRHD